MTYKDLMVGDYVQIKNVGLIIKITEIDGTYDAVNYFNKEAEGELTLSIKDIEPIPLTPEILEKNGWECFDTYHKYSHYRHPKAPFGILWRKEGGCTIEFKADESGGLAFLFILYVHQLQHALRLCGIEKEIVL